MPDPGDKLDRAYRDLAREEPPASIDAAILAASRRAVKAGPEVAPRRGFAQRYGAPISVAAVLVLGIAVALRMQVEQPGIETSLPAPTVPPPAQSTQPAPKAEPEPDRAAPPAPIEKPKARAKVAAPVEHKEVAPAEEKREVQQQAPAMQVAPAPAPMPQSLNAAPAAAIPAPAAPAAAAAPAARMAAPMMKRSATADTAGAAAESVAVTPEAELERIARLRTDGRDDEADRALEAFRKRYPDYRIAEAMWERVRRR